MIIKQEGNMEGVFGDKNTPMPPDVKKISQVHGKEVILVLDRLQQTKDFEADALVTGLPNVTLGIKTADCLPIFLYEPQAEIIAVVHAGWRGAKSGIIEASLEVMRGLGAKEIKAFIGPTIRPESYEVGPEFHDFFSDQYLITSNGKIFLDLITFAKDSLKKVGVTDLWDSNIDTYSNENFYSYRRAYQAKNPILQAKRNFSFIKIKN